MRVIARRFHALFAGLERAHGTYRVSGVPIPGQKLIGRAITVTSPVTDELWEKHLKGTAGLGVIPIRDDSTCLWGAIDVDQYVGIDLAVIAKKIEEFKLPLVPCRSKSGGLHAFIFLTEAVPAAVLRVKLKEFSAALGYGTSEVFPKQDQILAERGDIGGWINMPYFDAANTNRYGITTQGKPLTAEEFLEFAEAQRLPLTKLTATGPVLVSDFSDGPPCLQFLATHGFAPGSRNEALFNIGVYLKKAKPDTWAADLDHHNQRLMRPALASNEVQALVKSLRRKDYTYGCTKPPVCHHCNLDICRSRGHGIGMGAFSLQMTSLTKYNTSPPIWFVDIDGGGRLELSTGDLQDQVHFQRRCIDVLNRMPSPVNAAIWRATVQNLLDRVVVIEASMDSTPRGQLVENLEKFCTSKAQARAREEIILGKPWLEDGRHYFKLSDFMAYLERVKFKEYKANQVASILKELGGEHKLMKLKGKVLNVWSVPEQNRQSEGFDTPDYTKKEPF